MKEDKRCIIGVDIGGTFFRIGAVDQEQNILQFQKVRVRNVIHSENVLDDLCNFLIDFMTKVPYKAEGISIGFPATIDRNRTMVVPGHRISGLWNSCSEEISGRCISYTGIYRT